MGPGFGGVCWKTAPGNIREVVMAKTRRKNRKRTNANVPAKGRLKDMADMLWSVAVKEDWNNRCAICGRRGDLNSHHLIPRQHIAARHDLKNGCCLCRRCHQFCPDRSPHQNAGGFAWWLEEHYPNLAAWYKAAMKSRTYRQFAGTANATYYCDVIRRLKEYVPEDDYERIVGVRFSRWLEENE